jgi:CheY-like chemotaxis protein
MQDKTTYTLPEAARAAGVPEEELRKAIQDGLLPARVPQNTGEFHIASEDLRRYMKRTRHTDVLARRRPRRVLVLDDDVRFADVVKLELGRDGRLEVKFASCGRDGLMLVRNGEAELTLVSLEASAPETPELLAALRERRAAGKGKVIALSHRSLEVLRHDPAVRARLAELEADYFHEKALGLRPLTVQIYELLGLTTKTVVLKRHA